MMFLQQFIYDIANFLSATKCLQYQPFCHIYGFTEYLNAEKVVTDVSNGCVIQDQKNSNSQRNSTLHYFLFQTQLLHQDPDKGIIMSTQSLVLQKVTREMVGDYVCRAVNTEGSRESNPVALKIMCEYKLQNFYTFCTVSVTICFRCIHLFKTLFRKYSCHSSKNCATQYK